MMDPGPAYGPGADLRLPQFFFSANDRDGQTALPQNPSLMSASLGYPIQSSISASESCLGISSAHM